MFVVVVVCDLFGRLYMKSIAKTACVCLCLFFVFRVCACLLGMCFCVFCVGVLFVLVGVVMLFRCFLFWCVVDIVLVV